MLFLTALALLTSPQSISDADAVAKIRALVRPIATVEAGKGFADLEPLQSVLKDAVVVGMGESTHGSREIFQMKHRMFEFLVERMGFTVLALESSMPDTLAMDRFVTDGIGDVEAATRGQGFWTWATEEVRDLLLWMRKYNADPAHKRKLRVVGIDMQDRLAIWNFLVAAFKDAGLKGDPALDDVLWVTRINHASHGDGTEIFAKIDALTAAALPKLQAKYGDDYARLFRHMPAVYRQSWMQARQVVAREELMEEGRVARTYLQEVTQKAAGFLKEVPDMDERGRWGLTLLSDLQAEMQKEKPTPRKLREAADAVRAYKAKPEQAELRDKASAVLNFLAAATELGSMPVPIVRDQAMAENVEWLRKTYLPDQKIMVWAHNSHVGRSRVQGRPVMLGAFLQDKFKDGYFPVGFVFNEGSFRASGGEGRVESFTVSPAAPGSLDAFLQSTGQARFFLSLDGLDAGLKAWMSVPRPWRNIGSSYDPKNPAAFYTPLPAAELFRGLIFLSKQSAARPLKEPK